VCRGRLACLIGALTLLTVGLLTGCSSSGASAALNRAEQICESFVPPSIPTTVASPVGAEASSTSWTTAGQITSLAKRALGHALHPWDQLPTNHFVAECGYLDLTVATSTTNCPGTTLPSVGPDASEQFYVDAEHHSTAAIPPTSILPSYCAYGLGATTTSSNP
jgi:hypothetical protein